MLGGLSVAVVTGTSAASLLVPARSAVGFVLLEMQPRVQRAGSVIHSSIQFRALGPTRIRMGSTVLSGPLP
jgi:hypothetical protein